MKRARLALVARQMVELLASSPKRACALDSSNAGKYWSRGQDRYTDLIDKEVLGCLGEDFLVEAAEHMKEEGLGLDGYRVLAHGHAAT